MAKNRDPKQDKERKEKIVQLLGRVREHDTGLTQQDLVAALQWSRPPSKSSQIVPWNDRFSDPLTLADTIVSLTSTLPDNQKANRDTVLAAILYTSVIQEREKGFDCEEQIKTIKKRFGSRVGRIVEDTLSLWSLDRLPASTQAPVDNLRDYKLMALLVARSREAVLIRSTQAYANIREFDINTTRAKREHVLGQAEIMADLAYLARFPEVRRAILNEALRVRDPERYSKIRRHTSSTRLVEQRGDGLLQTQQDKKVKLTDEEVRMVEEQINTFLEKTNFVLRENYTVGIRVKDAYSTAEKTDKKQQDLEQLGDIYGGRLIIKDDYIQEKFGKPRPVEESDVAKKKERDPEQHAAEILYWKLSWVAGRNAPHLKHFYEELALRDPDSKDPTKDDRFDNYYRDVKPSGYRAVQDTFFFVVNGKLVEIEMQFVGEKTHENNTNGAPSHRLYKTNQTDNRSIIESWEKASDEVVRNEEDRSRVPYAAIYMPNNDIAVVKGTEDGCRVTDFVAQNLTQIQEQFPYIAHADDIIGVHLDNTNPLMKRDPEIPYSPVVKLRSGDRVTGFDVRGEAVLVPGG